MILIHAYALVGRDDDALRTLAGFVRLIVPPQDLPGWEEVWALADFQAVLERTVEGLENLTMTGRRNPGGHAFLARLYILNGQPNEALRCLETAFRAREPDFTSLMGDPVYDPVRDDPRFQAILRQMGLGA
jgi:hypothetical protein